MTFGNPPETKKRHIRYELDPAGPRVVKVVFPSARTDRLQWKGLEIGFAGRRCGQSHTLQIAAEDLGPFPIGWW